MRKALVLFAAILLAMMQVASAATFSINDYSVEELREIRRQIQEQMSVSQRGDVLYEDENVSIYYLGWRLEYGRYQLWITFINNTDKTLMLAADDTSVNDAACRANSSMEVPAGKRTNNYIFSVSESTLEEQWIDEIEYVEFTLRYYDSNDWQGLRTEIANPFVVEYDEP